MTQTKRIAGGSMIASLMLLTACNPSSGSSAPGAVSEGEAAALEDAAEMLDERQLPEGALPVIGPVIGPLTGPLTGPPIDAPTDAPITDEAPQAQDAQDAQAFQDESDAE